MNKQKIFLLAISTVVFGSSVSFAQTNFKVGDTIYVNAFYVGCVKATVKQTDPKYYIHIEEGNYTDKDVFYSAGRIDECPQKPAEPKKYETTDNQLPDVQTQTKQQQNRDGLKVGDRVDVYLSGGIEGKNRGTIIEIGDEYKIHYDGCAEKDDVWENSALVQPAAVISKNAAAIKFLLGRWSMTTVGISDDAIAWGKSPGIQINADGTYVWYQEDGKTPVTGEWTTHAKIEGARFGTETENGILITDAKGYAWKMYRRKSTLDNDDHVTIRMMCEGKTQMGTRIR